MAAEENQHSATFSSLALERLALRVVPPSMRWLSLGGHDCRYKNPPIEVAQKSGAPPFEGVPAKRNPFFVAAIVCSIEPPLVNMHPHGTFTERGAMPQKSKPKTKEARPRERLHQQAERAATQASSNYQRFLPQASSAGKQSEDQRFSPRTCPRPHENPRK